MVSPTQFFWNRKAANNREKLACGTRTSKAKHNLIGDVRSKGLLLVKNRATKEGATSKCAGAGKLSGHWIIAWQRRFITVRQLDVRADVLHPIRRRFLLEVPNQAFCAVCNNLSNALGVRNSESAHAQPKLDSIHAAEQVRSIFRSSGPPG